MPVQLTISYKAQRGANALPSGILSRGDIERLAGGIILQYARVAAPVAPQAGGRLQRSLIAANLLGTYGIFGAKTGLWTAEGTRAHKIPLSPKPPGRWLKFEWQGRTVFFKQVNHPRYVGTLWTRRAVLAAEPAVTIALVRVGRNILQYMVA